VPLNNLKREALVVTRDEKFIKFSNGVSISYKRANGPSILSKGSSANTIEPVSGP
jgi:hypothetical protein